MRRGRAALCLLVVLQLCPAQVPARSPACPSGTYTAAGDCCAPCPPGFGVAVPCGPGDTQCEPCRDNETFSAVSSAAERCRPCTACAAVARACTARGDAVCAGRCAPGHYALPGAPCAPCSPCGPGQGAARPCGPAGDAECRPCPAGFFSEERSAEAPCRPCRPGCGPGEVTLRPCGPRSDTLCMDKELQILKRAQGHPRKEAAAAPDAAPNASAAASEFAPPAPEDAGNNIIPVYCSILAAVVVGLLAYVAFKCWHTCKQKQQLAKARAGELGTAPEGEKLHSDSGVFLDTHSLQEPHQLSKAPRPEGQPYSALAPARREELERLLESGGPGGDWRALAARLGYEAEAVGTFARGRAPARTLLAAWAAADGATVEALGQALAAIGRRDAAERLAAPADASSLV
ncbi:tumor necrosis factor receptor superfamily member 16-like [Dromaius novaehollandiae]|uniref:tumor necrosis factor receptor superfamily member 16-like n=1 Tax=Dromaius novaehollandiae TaxID=8790 RepID=UPI00311E0581